MYYEHQGSLSDRRLPRTIAHFLNFVQTLPASHISIRVRMESGPEAQNDQDRSNCGASA